MLQDHNDQLLFVKLQKDELAQKNEMVKQLKVASEPTKFLYQLVLLN
ncbi:Uncharacterised protein [Chlamydia trachomatis]|nr:Uncharacterised protein [Chlamydia trachomatis]CRH46635.1 Uncharacterised protein [Chlamydia trachomatis]CRH54872.1 Uncharacterised protein [Chlamydia trachomatis]CRH55722.1 Uncharacterised protein [Chlamydia trachomatis]CRH56862.1 Uncharacterised protein [Chlamydia trachomatis]